MIHSNWEKIFDSQQWSEGKFTSEFEKLWEAWNDIPAVSFSVGQVRIWQLSVL